MMTPKYIAIIAALFCTVIAGCKKEEKETPNKPSTKGPGANFTITGERYWYSPLTYKSDAPSGTKHLWYFGGVDVSEEVSPTYSYNANGDDSTFTVRLLVNGVETEQEITLTPGVERIQLMSNWTKIYTRQYENAASEHTVDTLRTADTSFVLGLTANNKTVLLPEESGNKHFAAKNRTCNYVRIDNEFLSFEANKQDEYAISLKYNYLKKAAVLQRYEGMYSRHDTLYGITYISK